MSLTVGFNHEALEDLLELEQYLSLRFSERNADRYVRRLVAACHAIGFAPYRGSRREDIGPLVRAVGFEGRVTIVFQIKNDSVMILALLYGGREPA